VRKKSETKMTLKKNKSLINLFTCYITYHSSSCSSSCYSCIVSYVVVLSSFLLLFLLAVAIKIMNSMLYLNQLTHFVRRRKRTR
jgi:hypothetical protein